MNPGCVEILESQWKKWAFLCGALRMFWRFGLSIFEYAVILLSRLMEKAQHDGKKHRKWLSYIIHRRACVDAFMGPAVKRCVVRVKTSSTLAIEFKLVFGLDVMRLSVLLKNIKRYSSPKNENPVIIYYLQLSCHPKPSLNCFSIKAIARSKPCLSTSKKKTSKWLDCLWGTECERMANFFDFSKVI